MKKVLLTSIIASSVLLGANVPNVDAIQNSISVPKVIEEKQESKKNELIEVGGKKVYEPMMIDDKSGKKILVKNIAFDGNNHILNDELNSLLAQYKNKELNFADMQNVASVVTKLYRDKGYFVARAYVPKQNIQENSNVLKISVIEGSYGEFKLINNSNVNDSIVQGMLDDAKARDNVVSTDTLERSMLIINDTPGVMVTKADVKPGKEVGSSDFVIETAPTALYDGYVVGDNAGSKFTGKNRLMAGVNLNSPLNLGDKLSVSGLISNGENIKNYKVGYEIPLMSNGLKGQTSYSRTDYNLVKMGQTTPDGIYDGNTSTIEAGISYPIIRTRMENLNFTTLYSNKELKDYYVEALNKNREINSVKLGLDYIKNHTLLGFDSSSKIETFYTLGKLDIKDETSKNQDKAGVNNQGTYSKVNVNLGNQTQFNPTYSLNTNVKTQYALNNKNLDGSEDFTLGGMEGVKVFSDGEQSVENAIMFNAEFQIKLPEIQTLNHKIGFFYDVATGDMSNSDKDTQFKRRTLQDVGIGYYTNYKNAFTKLQVARVIGNEDIESENVGDSSRILFQAGLTF
ncbi:MAG: ShlB/FhaC/HecB family hemolysin secretion/activation protein [Aliarcobacter sp.]|nr:ShlB/FhaC/HecB family hemolysin secretion/activation protein [Aliarcobacter sp.]